MRLLFTNNMKLPGIYFGLILFITFLLSGCGNNEPKRPPKNESIIETAFDLDARLKSADSLVVVFYKDPYGEDSLRYTRYYTQLPVIDYAGLNVLQQQLNQKFTKQEKRNTCRGEGKIWCYTKSKIFQTLYFSTRCDSCCYVYLIKDGFFYYTRILQPVITWLAGLKPLSKEPKNEAASYSD